MDRRRYIKWMFIVIVAFIAMPLTFVSTMYIGSVWPFGSVDRYAGMMFALSFMMFNMAGGVCLCLVLVYLVARRLHWLGLGWYWAIFPTFIFIASSGFLQTIVVPFIGGHLYATGPEGYRLLLHVIPLLLVLALLDGKDILKNNRLMAVLWFFVVVAYFYFAIVMFPALYSSRIVSFLKGFNGDEYRQVMAAYSGFIGPVTRIVSLATLYWVHVAIIVLGSIGLVVVNRRQNIQSQLGGSPSN